MDESVKLDFRQTGPLVLAYMGDAYIELLARETLILSGKRNIGTLNKQAREFVTAKNQSEAAKNIENVLTEEEHNVFRQGLNSKPHSLPKSATAAEYMRATALECLFGFLYFKGRHDRARELFELCYINKGADK